MKRIIFDIINGIRSGIPICCVIAYLRDSYNNLPVALHRSKQLGYDLQKSGYQYVPCSKCYKNKKIVPLKFNGVILFGWANQSQSVRLEKRMRITELLRN